MDHVCKICGKKFETGPALGGHRNTHLSFDQIKSDGARKRHLIREHGHQCQSCGREDHMGQPIPLVLDHIDGNTDNSSRDNLRIICHNCHALTPTFAGKNVGRFPSSQRNTKRAKYYWKSKQHLAP